MNDTDVDFLEIFPWNKNFETGIKEVDVQHQKLVEIINELAFHLVNDSDNVILEQYFDRLSDYTKYHFSTEEGIWGQYFHDDAWVSEHEHTHEAFIQSLDNLKIQSRKHSLHDVIQDVVSFLTKWLAFHILDTDKRMALAVLSIQQGASIAEAKIRSDEIMSGSLKMLVETVLSMYEQLSIRTMEIMREKHLRQKIEHELIKAKEVAEQANLEKSQFLANMSHELRTPMHAIISFANLGLKRSNDEKLDRYLQNIRTSGIRLTGILNDLLNLTSLEAGKMQPDLIMQDITMLMEHAIEGMHSLLVNKQMTVSFDRAVHYECMIDQNLMMQVLVNLMSNAVNFSPAGSEIHIQIAETVKPVDRKSREYIQITITDEGMGVPQKDLHAIFESFHQSEKTKKSVEGTGLGLPISREIISLHKGVIWAESPPPSSDVGTVFYIEIPKRHDQIAAMSVDSMDDAIQAHKKWIAEVDNMIQSSVLPAKSLISAAADPHLCSLGQMIDSIDSETESFVELKHTHQAFHELVGECFAHFEMKNYEKAMKIYSEFNIVSENILVLLAKIKSETEV